MTMTRSRTAIQWISAGVAALALAVAVPQSHAASPALQMARQFNAAFVEVAAAAAPAVVSIAVEQPLTGAALERFLRRGLQTPPVATGSGSGFVITEDGYIVTNNHVVEDAEKITVRMKDGREFKAVVRGTDPLSDIAVLKIEAKGLKPLKLADSAAAKVGEFVIAIGAPFGLDHTVTVGHISAKGRAGLTGSELLYTDQDFIQTDASINPGNSGGALVNLYGEVVGIPSMIRGMNTGIGFAIPSNLAKQVSDSLIKNGKLTRSRLGVGIASLREMKQSGKMRITLEDGVFITGVMSDVPAAKILKPNDVVVAVDGKKVATPRELQDQIFYKTPGDTVTLDVFRDGKNSKLKVQTAAIPEEQAVAVASRASPVPNVLPVMPKTGETAFGMRVEPLSDKLAAKRDVEKGKGVAVAFVFPDTLADQRSIRSGDVITEVNGKPVDSPKEFAAAVKAADPKLGVKLNILNDGTSRLLVLKDAAE